MGSSGHWIGRRAAIAVIVAVVLAMLITVRHDTRAATTTVAMQNLAFAPGSVTVSVGTTVTWTNQEPAASKIPHTVTSDSNAFKSAILNPGASFSFTFEKAGAFPYHCDVHPDMHGTITVTAPATATPTATRAPPTPTPVPTAAPNPPTATPTTPPSTPIPGAPTATPTVKPTPTIRPTTTAIVASGTPAAAIATSTPATGTPIPGVSTATTNPVSANDPPPPRVNPFLTVPAFVGTATERFMPQTGHGLKNDFRAFWETHGGAEIFGLPVSEEYREREADGVVRTVQYFERARFEYHDEFAGTPNAVELGTLARALTVRRVDEQPFQPVTATGAADQTWFDGTGHSLGGAFKRYWDTHGGLAIFGLPISEPFMEQSADDGQTYLVQYFERARFELHTGTSGQTVELGRLGVQYAQSFGMLPSA
jgi:plastocyanin